MKRITAATLATGLTLGAATSAMAQGYNEPLDPGWTFEAQLYLWATEVAGTALGRDFSLGFDEIVENLNFAFMGRLNAFNGPWMVFGELAYADLRQGGDAKFSISPEPDVVVDVKAVADADVQTTIASFGGGYKLVDSESYSMYGTFGARYLRLESQLEIDLNARSFETETSDDYWDAVVGVAGRAGFDENWFLGYSADVGGGSSDLTWQLYLGLGYSFGRQDVVLGYRHMEWDLPDDDLITEYSQSGPILLWNIRF